MMRQTAQCWFVWHRHQGRQRQDTQDKDAVRHGTLRLLLTLWSLTQQPRLWPAHAATRKVLKWAVSLVRQYDV